jgi:Domain of unknown function (DUF1918)
MHAPSGRSPLAAPRTSLCGGPEGMLYERAASARLRRARKRETQSVGTRIEIEVANAAEGSGVVECLWRGASRPACSSGRAVGRSRFGRRAGSSSGCSATPPRPWSPGSPTRTGLGSRFASGSATTRFARGSACEARPAGRSRDEGSGRRSDRRRERAGGRQGRAGVIEEILSGNPPRYRVRWDDGHTSSLAPAAGAVRIERRAKRR